MTLEELDKIIKANEPKQTDKKAKSSAEEDRKKSFRPIYTNLSIGNSSI